MSNLRRGGFFFSLFFVLERAELTPAAAGVVRRGAQVLVASNPHNIPVVRLLGVNIRC